MALVTPLLAGTAASQPGSGQFSIAGHVTNTRTGRPIDRALVQITRFSAKDHPRLGDRSTASPPPLTLGAFTDSSGTFRFETLAAGIYSISVRKPQFYEEREEEEGAATQTVDLTASVENLTLKLTPMGVITGKVLDQDANPMGGVNVVALSIEIVDGLRQIKTDRNVSTDDRGMYRLWNMLPGKYFIKAVGRSGGTYMYAGDASPQFFADESFAPLYFGVTRSLDSATPILIEAGTEARADISIKLESAFKIRGSLSNFAPRRTVKFELMSGGEDVSTGRVAVNGDTGHFEVQYVVPGSYVLRATQDDNSAEAPVSVSGMDVGGITLSLANGVDVKGVARIIKRLTDDPLSGVSGRRNLTAGCAVELHSAGKRSGETYPSVRGEGDEIHLSGVMPGYYRVAVQCFDAYVQSMFWGTQDLLADPILTVPPGGTQSRIEVIAKQGGGQIRGKVAFGPSSKQHDIHVLLVPQFPGSPGPVLITASEEPDNGSGFYFSAESLAPGIYLAYAFLKGDDVEYRSPAFLRSLSGGVSFQVEEGSTRDVSITDVIR